MSENEIIKNMNSSLQIKAKSLNNKYFKLILTRF